MDHTHYQYGQPGPSNYAVTYPPPPPQPMPPGAPPYGATYQPYYYPHGHMQHPVYPMGNHPPPPMTNNTNGHGQGYYHNTHPRRANRGYHNNAHSNQSHMHQQPNRQRQFRPQRYTASPHHQQQPQPIPSYPSVYGAAPVPAAQLPHQLYPQHIHRSPLMQPVYTEPQMKSPIPIPISTPAPISPAPVTEIQPIQQELAPSPGSMPSPPVLVIETAEQTEAVTEAEAEPLEPTDVQEVTTQPDDEPLSPPISPSSHAPSISADDYPPPPPDDKPADPELSPPTEPDTLPTIQTLDNTKQTFVSVTGELPTEEWVISLKPTPSQAFAITISPNAKPPKHIVDGAVITFGLATSLPSSPHVTPVSDVSPSPPQAAVKAQELPTLDSPMQSEQHSVAETESVTSTVPDTQIATPASTCTSVSANPPRPVVSNEIDPNNEGIEKNSSAIDVAVKEVTASLEQLTPSNPDSGNTTVKSVNPPNATSPPPVKKSWASLLQPQANGKSSSSLPTSSIVGFSIPAQQQSGPSSKPALSSPSKVDELVQLLTKGVPADRSHLRIRPRGLVNTGNMCFANAVLQVFVYCQPFRRLFLELDKYDLRLGKDTQKAVTAPLAEATTVFLKEFLPKAQGKNNSDLDDDFEGIDSFVPGYVYDALKENKRFDGMRFGQQEDAEEFLGFFLDTLEEELLSLQSSLRPASQHSLTSPAKPAGGDTREDGWMEVGKKNKALVTRSIKSADSPITRIFGGKFRSTLKVPGQRDSVLVEDWRALQLDIQREQVLAVEDALRFISHPQPVQVASVTKGGAVVDATQQVQVDSLPPILVLHMKRFLYDTKANGVVKIGKQITFGPELELPAEALSSTLRSARPIKYKLFAVLYHHGQSAAGGHYTLDVLHPNRNADLNAKPREGWIRIDDELVSDLRPQDMFGGSGDDRCAYLLFYSRVGGSALYSRV